MKKLLIVVDMEGIAGIRVDQYWPTVPWHPSYILWGRRLLVEETNAAIRGALKAGLKPEEIVIADWHWLHHNLRQTDLPQGVTLVREKESDFLKRGIEKVFLIGFHAMAEAEARYGHSMRYMFKTLRVNDTSIGEASFWAYSAGSMNVPIALLTGDSFAVKEVHDLKLETICVETKNETSTPDPTEIHARIESAAGAAIHANIPALTAPSPFTLKFAFKSDRLNHAIDQKYITRRDGEYLVLEGSTAWDVYNDFRDRTYAYIRQTNPWEQIRAQFMKVKKS